MASKTETRNTSARRLLVTGGAVVAVGLAVGLGSWPAGLLGQRHGATAAMSEATAAGETRSTQSTGDAASAPTARSAAAPAPLVVYLCRRRSNACG
jgi:hypothetical protein